MYKATIVLHTCGPLSARISPEACIEARKKTRGYRFNNDNDGIPDLYSRCIGCSGLLGGGKKVSVTAGPPRPDRVAVMIIDGVFGYV